MDTFENHQSFNRHMSIEGYRVNNSGTTPSLYITEVKLKRAIRELRSAEVEEILDLKMSTIGIAPKVIQKRKTMSHRIKIIKEWVDVLITSANQKVKETFEVDKHASRIIGIAITANDDLSAYYRGTQRIAFNEKEIYPEGYETKLLMQGINVPVNERIISFGEELEPGNRKAEIEYTDTVE